MGGLPPPGNWLAACPGPAVAAGASGRGPQNALQLIDRRSRLTIQFGLRLADFGQVLVVGRWALPGRLRRCLLHRLQLAAARIQIGC